jgi:hypothetical protein
MKRTPTILILLLAVTALTGLAAYHKYETRKVAAAKAMPDYSALYTASQKQVKLLTQQNGVLQAIDTQLTMQKGQLCTDLSNHKLTDPLCN